MEIEYLDVSFKEPALSHDRLDILSLYEYFQMFVTTEMLQTMVFQSNRYSLQHFGKIYWLLFSDGYCKNAQPTIFLERKPQFH